MPSDTAIILRKQAVYFSGQLITHHKQYQNKNPDNHIPIWEKRNYCLNPQICCEFVYVNVGFK